LKEPRAEALRWLQQAENDLAYARLGLREGFHAQVCFQCQQICEMAILDQYYIPTRYPDGLPGGLPFEVYTADQDAVATCDRVIDLARQRLPAE
jgi:HEPN domain-containing protein